MATELNPSINNKSGTQKAYEIEPVEKRWFCVAMYPDGSIVNEEADTPDNFINILQDALISWMDFRTVDYDKDVRVAGAFLGFSDQLLASLTGDSTLLYEDLDNEMGLKLTSVQIRLEPYPDVQAHPTLMLIRKNFLITIHPLIVDRRFSRLRRYANKVLQRIPLDLPMQDRLTLLLMRIMDQNNDRNFEHLRQIEEYGDELSRRLMDPEIPRDILGPEIYNMKHALITYLNALWESVSVLQDVRYGDAELITDDPHLLEQLGLLADSVKQQIGLAEHLSEVLASGLEVLQSIYNNQLQVLNNRMALIMTYLTVLGTAVLVPNTLATIFSNPAFEMGPEDVGWYSIMLVASTILATALSFWWVKKSGWIPKKVD